MDSSLRRGEQRRATALLEAENRLLRSIAKVEPLEVILAELTRQVERLCSSCAACSIRLSKPWPAVYGDAPVAHDTQASHAIPFSSPSGEVSGELFILLGQPNDLSAADRAIIARLTDVAGVAVEAEAYRVSLIEDREELSRSKTWLRASIDTLPVSIFCVPRNGMDEFWNKRWLDYSGLSHDEAVEQRGYSIIHPDDQERLAQNFNASLFSGEPGGHEARLRRHDGVYRWFLSRWAPLRDETGHIVEWWGANTDIDDAKRTEEALTRLSSELAHMSRVSSLGVLSASIAHEVNQPLTGVITNASTCLKMMADDSPNLRGAREAATRIIRDGNRAAEVVQRLRTLFSKRDPVFEPVDLNELAREVIALAASDLRRRDLIVDAELADGLAQGIGDRVQLQQVILNLILNAADAMADVDGRQRRILIRTAAEEGDRVCLSVEDAGVGFEPGSAESLFEAFWTSKEQGMGMGLSISRSIIDAHGGRLQATLNDGPGATFSFSIPSASQGAQA